MTSATAHHRVSPVRQETIETLMKSPERVRDLGEVFTSSAMVEAMLDLLPASMWEPHPSANFLEPAAGDGNFLVAILARKLAAVSAARTAGTLAAGTDVASVEFHALEALASIYGVDISVDNIVGGTPGQEVGARTRMLDVFARWLEAETGTPVPARSPTCTAATWILERNLLVANMLPFEADGRPSRRSSLPLVEYRWQPQSRTVEVRASSLGQVESAARVRTGEQNLFDEFEVPAHTWSGPVLGLPRAAIPAPPVASAVRNERG